MPMRYLLALTAASALAATPAHADVVCEWMDFAGKIQSAAAPPQSGPLTGEHDRAQSQVALAMFEALNAVDRRYQSYLGLAENAPGGSQEAAAATAAYRVLLSHFPSQKASIEESYAMALESVPDPAARQAGQKVGEAAAAAALQAGKVDPSVAPTPYLPRAQVGVWVPVQLPVFAPSFMALKPWFIERADAVRPAPPPAIASERYTRDFEEVKRLGGKTSSARTPHQTLMARYRITPDMMPALRMIADGKGRKAVENARLFALFHMINDDALLAVGDAKLHYDYWRPITAIRNAESDGNPMTAADPSWEPLITTPNHPEYPCGHCILAAATAELMELEYGNVPPWGVRVASRSIPNAAVQVLPDWDTWVEEVSFSRTLGGVHYRFSNEVGEEMGRKVARTALAKAMKPLR
jgi:hypothetical protein